MTPHGRYTIYTSRILKFATPPTEFEIFGFGSKADTR